MKEFLRDCHSYSGRWNRKKFLLYPLAIFLFVFILHFVLFGISSRIGPTISSALFILVMIAYLYSIYVSIIGYIKRFHDLGKSGWYVLLLCVPFVNLFVLIWLAFFRGTQGPNMYGADPLMEDNLEKRFFHELQTLKTKTQKIEL